ncbi:hypothetical protein MESS2_990001 [Mesorhizobium metallidurans STM 2683]|uniref:Uncharacterized protein n=1 Tax=Mesorhizobium metallidurans STM 2683 TaxID=1297569 RepID=M5EYY3_9HYPH|nr:hypothetical protein MESS2_990001 [Mesorhizobium metallidurans STM 2683]
MGLLPSRASPIAALRSNAAAISAASVVPSGNPRPIMRIPPLGHAASVRLVRVSALVASILGEIPHLRLRQWSVSEAIGR